MFNPPLNLADYMGLEMRVRTSNHGFIFNIHPDNMVPSDLDNTIKEFINSQRKINSIVEEKLHVVDTLAKNMDKLLLM